MKVVTNYWRPADISPLPYRFMCIFQIISFRCAFRYYVYHYKCQMCLLTMSPYDTSNTTSQITPPCPKSVFPSIFQSSKQCHLLGSQAKNWWGILDFFLCFISIQFPTHFFCFPRLISLSSLLSELPTASTNLSASILDSLSKPLST